MATEETTTALVFTRQLGGAEDSIFGFGTEIQVRNGKSVLVTHVNAAHIPYNSTMSVKDKLDDLEARVTSLGG